MSNRRKLRKPRVKAPVCLECRNGNHTGHAHQVCPKCERRIEPGMLHICRIEMPRD